MHNMYLWNCFKGIGSSQPFLSNQLIFNRSSRDILYPDDHNEYSKNAFIELSMYPRTFS